MKGQLALHWLKAVLDPRRVLGLAYLPRYLADWRRYSRLPGAEHLRWRDSYPCLVDWIAFTPYDPHYFYQAAWAVRKLAVSAPRYHVDVGSSVMMIGVLSALFPTIFVDYRPLKAEVPGLMSTAGNLLALPLAEDCLLSLSCLHVIEHVGLGRYGDSLDPEASHRAARELVRVLAPGGRLLLSTVLGRARVEFNAHRVFAPAAVLAMFHDLQLASFALVDDAGNYSVEATPDQAADCEYACGMFEFVKP